MFQVEIRWGGRWYAVGTMYPTAESATAAIVSHECSWQVLHGLDLFRIRDHSPPRRKGLRGAETPQGRIDLGKRRVKVVGLGGRRAKPCSFTT